MTLQDKQRQSHAVDLSKKPYSPPQLFVYGDLVEQTLRGSGTGDATGGRRIK